MRVFVVGAPRGPTEHCPQRHRDRQEEPLRARVAKSCVEMVVKVVLLRHHCPLRRAIEHGCAFASFCGLFVAFVLPSIL